MTIDIRKLRFEADTHEQKINNQMSRQILIFMFAHKRKEKI